MSRRIIGVLVAVLLASVGTFTLVSWAASAEERVLAGERTVEVLVVREAIPAGVPAEELGTRVERERVPVKVRAEGGVDAIDDLAGMVTAVDLVPGEQLVTARFAPPDELARRSAVAVPEHLQEVTLSLEPQRAVGGRLRPGDTVGLVASFAPVAGEGTEAGTPSTTHLILHKVLVTRVQAVPTATVSSPEGTEDGPEPTPGSDLLITLALDAPSVERVVFAQEFGSVWLTAEPATASESGTRVQDRRSIYQ